MSGEVLKELFYIIWYMSHSLWRFGKMLNTRKEENRKRQFKRAGRFSFYPGSYFIKVHWREIHRIKGISRKGKHGTMISFQVCVILSKCYHFKSTDGFRSNQIRIRACPSPW